MSTIGINVLGVTAAARIEQTENGVKVTLKGAIKTGQPGANVTSAWATGQTEKAAIANLQNMLMQKATALTESGSDTWQSGNWSGAFDVTVFGHATCLAGGGQIRATGR
ncbi:hypothetical protein HYV31_00375 [candidate division WWE3 bacterium]|nr:hypothetical protein [candidate division WWE3 bacterium]